ncbi:hypothetical protein [Halorubrum aquaticum]|uniref:hypothetical protein n=1 Tax=Halorubrum aquaticum TaxID=387340 RepID=UPI00122D42FB|nr:hypothetical protein [Halorubrum aquaticum]
MERRKFVIGVGSLAAGGAAATGTGAFTAAELNGRTASIGVVDDTQGLIGLEAGDSELVTDSGGDTGNELQIDFNTGVNGKSTGVNPNSTYQVGGLGGIDNLDQVPGSGSGTSALDIAIDTTSDIENNCAFRLMNQSGSSQQIEITYQANDSLPSGAEVYMISHYDQGDGEPEETSALEARATPDDRSASILYDEESQYSSNVASGTDVEVTLIVDVDDVSAPDDLGGEIVVRAGSHDDFIDTDDSDDSAPE